MKVAGSLLLIGMLLAAVPAEAQGPFVELGDGTVLDQGTGLTWVQEASSETFSSADAGVQYCESLDFAGHDDWRLPRVDELATITDYRSPDLSHAEFDGPAVIFWSATPRANDARMSWTVNFGLGTVSMSSWSRDARARCARGGPFWELETAPRLVVQSEETALDVRTGLQWQRATAGSMTWADAGAYCGQLELDGYDDWRLPAIGELQSIVDYGQIDPAADPAVFEADLADYWSGTENARYPELAWKILFATGTVGRSLKGYDGRVRCVRAVQAPAAGSPSDFPDPVQMLGEALEMQGIYPDPDGAVHAAPNFISKRQLQQDRMRGRRMAAAAYVEARRKGGSWREAWKIYKQALKSPPRAVELSGYLVNRLALLLGREAVPAAYVVIGDVRIDLKAPGYSVLDDAGYFRIQTEIDGSRGDVLDVRLFAAAPDGTEVQVDATRIVFEK
jgi:hypothetical protein